MSSRKLLIRNYNENKKSRQCFEGLLVNHVLLTNSLCAVTYQFTRFSLATLIVHQSVDRSTNPFHHGLLVSSLWWKGFMERQSNGRWKWQEQNWWTGCDVWSEVKYGRDDEKRHWSINHVEVPPVPTWSTTNIDWQTLNACLQLWYVTVR